jgi:hypothetical protein
MQRLPDAWAGACQSSFDACKLGLAMSYVDRVGLIGKVSVVRVLGQMVAGLRKRGKKLLCCLPVGWYYETLMCQGVGLLMLATWT